MDFITELLETPAMQSPTLAICACGHVGKVGNVLCFVCHQAMVHEQVCLGRIKVQAPYNTPDALVKLGISRTSAWRALKRGWFIVDYHHPKYLQGEGLGGFEAIRDPIAFARAQVRHVFNQYGIGRVELIEDFAQAGLLKCWELRHYSGVVVWENFFAAVIRRKAKDLLDRELKYVPQDDTNE